MLVSKAARGLAPVGVSLLLLLSGCGGSGSSGSGDDLESVLQRSLGMETSCPALTPSVTRAVPGSTVVLSGVPDSLGESGIRMIAAEPDTDLVSPIFLHEDSAEGTASFTLPLHPSTAAEGGEVMMELGDGVLR